MAGNFLVLKVKTFLCNTCSFLYSIKGSQTSRELYVSAGKFCIEQTKSVLSFLVTLHMSQSVFLVICVLNDSHAGSFHPIPAPHVFIFYRQKPHPPNGMFIFLPIVNSSVGDPVTSD